VNLATRDFTVAHCTQYFPTARVSSGGRIRDFVPVQAQAREVLLGIHPGRKAGDFRCRFRFSLQACLWHYGPPRVHRRGETFTRHATRTV